MSLLTFLEHEVVFEYEKVKDQLFDDNRKPRKYLKEADILDHDIADFHPVFLSSLLNQTVFIGDIEEQKHKEKLQKGFDLSKQQDQQRNQDAGDDANQITDKQDTSLSARAEVPIVAIESDAKIYRAKKDNLLKLYQYVDRWINEIDNYNYIMTMNSKENQETARSIQNLLDRALKNWKDPK